jgi:Protein of unknown function (DUF3558)
MSEKKGMSVRRVVIAAELAATLFGLTACGGAAVSGQPGPEITTTGGESGTNNVTTAPAAPSLNSMDPCTLLSGADQQALSFSAPGTRKDLGGAQSCRWTSASSVLHADIRSKQGLADLVNDGPTTESVVGTHQSRQMRDSTGGCLVAIAVSSSSRVDVGAVDTHRNQDAACMLVAQAAKLIEPKLPKS